MMCKKTFFSAPPTTFYCSETMIFLSSNQGESLCLGLLLLIASQKRRLEMTPEGTTDPPHTKLRPG